MLRPCQSSVAESSQGAPLQAISPPRRSPLLRSCGTAGRRRLRRQCRLNLQRGGVGFIFGSSKHIACVFTKPDGTAERYHGEIDKYGVDIGFTNEGYMVWAVFAPGQVAKGALAGTYAGATADVAAGPGSGAKVLLGGSNEQIALQPVGIEGTIGLNVAAGFG